MNAMGIQTVVVTGRKCLATERRMSELKVKYLYQEIREKKAFLEIFIREKEIAFSEIGFIGDDLNDYMAMSVCGFKACPSDACREIKEIADYVSVMDGGRGVVRDIAEYILKSRGQWDDAIMEVYEITKA